MNAIEVLLGEAALARHGARTALLCEDASLDYAELAARCARASAALRDLGIAPGERVLLLMRDTFEYAVAWLGIVRAGAVAIGLNTKLTETEFRHARADSGARLVITETHFLRARPELLEACAGEGLLAVAGDAVPPGAIDWRASLARARAAQPAHAATPGHPAFWLYSSGTTGLPKGIPHAHKDLLPAGQGMREVLGLGAGDRVLSSSKLFFAYALEHGFLGALAIGAGAILHPDWADPETMSALVARHRPAAFFSVPSFYRRLLALPAEAVAPFRGVRRCVAAGEQLPESVQRVWRGTVGNAILGVYGTSETFCACLATPPGEDASTSTGRPLAGVETKLVASDAREAATGEPGVLWLRHPALAEGYANRPEATRAQFVDGWYCTRDVFVRDADGRYTHQGRSDDFVKIAGQWVQPGEIEGAAALAEAVLEVACVPVNDDAGFERLALFVVPRSGADDAIDAARNACEASLPRYKWPRWIRAIDAVPRTATGKMQRYKLREILERELRGAD